jgi:cell division protein FtsB
MRRRRPRQSGAAVAASNPLGLARLGRPGVALLTLLLVVLSIWSLAGFVGQVISSAQMERRKEELRVEKAQLEAENARLKQQVAEVKSPAYADQIAREQLGYAREGDTVILPTLPQTTPTPPKPTAQPLPTSAPVPNWRGWMQALFPPADTR